MEYLSVCTKKVQKRRSYLTIEPALFLFMFASFLSYPIYQELLHHTFCQQDPSCQPPPPHTRNQSSCSSESYPDSVRNKTSHWILYTNLSLGITSLILSLLYGSLSDAAKERRVFLILPSVGATINALLVVVVQYTSPDYTWVYLIGAGLSGLTGGVSVFNLSAYSYAADISNHGDRTQRMGWLEATTYTSSFLSQLIGGVWIDRQGYATPYFGVIACHVTVVFYVLLFLPAQEENREEQPRPLGDDKPLLVNATINKPPKRKKAVEVFLRVYHFIHLLCHSWQHLCLALVFLILEINFLGIIDTVILYAISKLCWDSKTIGYFLAEKSGFNAIAALLVLPLLVRFRVSDPVIGIIGLLFGSAALVVMGFATQTWIMFIGMYETPCILGPNYYYYSSSYYWSHERLCSTCCEINGLKDYTKRSARLE